VTEFQRKYGIDDDGVAGPNTRMVIYAALAKYQTPKLVSEAMAPREGA
jgi:murein L,D-transpeptidase YcbB/YkuD